MKINFLKIGAIALIMALGVSCSQKDSADEKIKALEDKIAALETSNTAITPVNAQATQVADPSSLGQFEFPEVRFWNYC
jgi:prefoldin subunit 5